MFLKNGDYIKASGIDYMTVVKTKKGERRWNATMTKEIIDPDIYYIDIKMSAQNIRLQYTTREAAEKEYMAIVKELQH